MKSASPVQRPSLLSKISVRTRVLVGVFAGLALVYLVVFTDRLNPTPIQMVVSIRGVTPKKLAKVPIGNVLPVAFSLDAKYRLTSIQVFESDSPTGNAPAGKPVWHLKSGLVGSFPTKMILYGLPVPWMKPASPSQPHPQPLVAGKSYRLVVHSGRRKGEVTFTPVPAPNVPTPQLPAQP